MILTYYSQNNSVSTPEALRISLHYTGFTNKMNFSLPWLLMFWQRTEPGHQQPWYWQNYIHVHHNPMSTIIQLDMSTAHQRLKSPQSLSGTSAHPTMVTLVNFMVMNGWLTSFSFHVNQPSHSWDQAISDPDLEISTPRSRSWVWSKGKVIQSAQYHIILTHFVFVSHQSDQQFLRKSYSEIWPWNIQGQGHEWGQRSRSHIVPSIQSMHFLFVSHQSDQPFLIYGQNSVWPWKNTSEIFKENLPK